MEKIKVYKIGGNVIDAEDKLESFLKKFSTIENPKILVHGGGKIATKLATQMGLQVTMIDGRRVTDKAMLDLVVMTYAGLINKSIVRTLVAMGTNAIGLCGADGRIIFSKIRSKEPIDYGYVGDPISVNTEMLTGLLELGLVPIVAPITANDESLLNTNADTIAQTLATSLAKVADVELHYEFEKRGVLLDVDNEDSVIEYINECIFRELKSQGKVSAGMLPKLQNALKAVESGVSRVFIGDTIISR